MSKRGGGRRVNELALFASYCRRMSTSDHVDDCPSLRPPPRPQWRLEDHEPDAPRLDGFTPAPPPCDGCISPEDRELWAQLADEIEGHLDAERDEAGLF